MDIKNQTVLVTGTNRGIGKALVTALLDRGAGKIYATVRNSSKSPTFTDNRVVPVEVDITNAEQVNQLAGIATDVNILINNAGVATYGKLLALDKAALTNDLEVNYFGTLNMIKAFVPVLEKNRPSAIVNNVTIGAFANFPVLGGYCASKAATYSLTQGMRIELADKNIPVYGIYPGPIDTDMAKDFPIDKTPPLECANAILDGLEREDINIFPDPVSRQLHEVWRNNYLELETTIRNMG